MQKKKLKALTITPSPSDLFIKFHQSSWSIFWPNKHTWNIKQGTVVQTLCSCCHQYQPDQLSAKYILTQLN